MSLSLPSKKFAAKTFFPLILLLLGDIRAMGDCQPLIIDLLFGEPISIKTMLDDLATVKIIYLGEIHSIPRHHEIQTQILRQLTDRQIELSLGMEMFSENQQPFLEKWQHGREDVGDLIKELGKDHWTNLQDYKSVLLQARDLGIPIFGLNAPDGLVRKVAQEGLDSVDNREDYGLQEEARNINPLYERLLRLRLQVHKSFKDRSLDRIVLAQSFRDATMARAVTRILNSPKGENRVVIVIAGTGHLNYGFGIPERVHQQTGLPFRIILPSESGELDLSEEEKRQSVPARINHQDLAFIGIPIADYLHAVPLKEDTYRHSIDFPGEKLSPEGCSGKGVRAHEADSRY